MTIPNPKFNPNLPESATNQRMIFETPTAINQQTGQLSTGGYTLPTTPVIITPQSLEPISSLPYVNPNQPIIPDISGFNITPLVATPQETQQSDLIKQLQSLTSETIGESAYRTQQEQAQGISKLTKTQNDLATQLKAIQNETLAIPLQLQQESIARGITTGGLQPIQTAMLRNNAIKALSINSLLEASRGNLATAQSMVDRAVAAKYDPMKEKINALRTNLDLIIKDSTTTLTEKNRAQAQLDIQNEKAKQNEFDKQNATDIWLIATTAASNGSNFTATTQYPTLAVVLNAISKSKTKEEALAIATQTGLKQTPIKPVDNWSAPYLLGGNYVQKNKTTGEIRTAVNVAKPSTIETRDTTVGTFLQNKKGTDGYVSASDYQEGLRKFIAGGGNQTNFIASFPQQTYLRQQEIDKLPVALRPQTTISKSDLTPDQTSIINDAKAAIDQVKQRYGDWGAIRQQIIEQSKQQYNFDISPYI